MKFVPHTNSTGNTIHVGGVTIVAWLGARGRQKGGFARGSDRRHAEGECEGCQRRTGIAQR